MSLRDALKKRFRESQTGVPPEGRYPMDERTPSGHTIYESVRGLPPSGRPSPDFEQFPQGQVLTPQNREAITRPRTVTPDAQPSFTDALKRRMQPTFNGQPIFADDVNGEPFGTRERRTQPRDFIADDSQYLRDVESQPRNWKDKTVGVLDAISEGFGNKHRSSLTKRERDIQRAQGNLGADFKVQQAQLGQMTPVTLEDGTVVQVPARSAGSLQSQQQRIKQQGAESERRKEMDKNRVSHWSNMDASSRKRLIAGLYGSGALNSPELLEYAADELGVPGTLREKFVSGQMRDAIDENGNLIQVNRQTQKVTPVLGQAGQPQGSFAKTQLAATNTRAANAQAGATARAGMRGTQGVGRKITAGERKDIAETAATVRAIHRQLTDVDSQINAIQAKGANASPEEQAKVAILNRKRKELVEGGALNADKLNQIDPENEWGSGTGGYPYSKPKVGGSDLERPIAGKPAGRQWDAGRFSAAFKAKHGRLPTQSEIDAYAAAAAQ